MTPKTAFAIESPSEPFEVLRAGRYLKGGRKIKITEADLDLAVANFDRQRAADEAEVPVDFDHSFADRGVSRAAGWVKALVRKGKGLHARVRWTDSAREMIARGEYRYVSAEFAADDQTPEGRRRGFTILGLGLTNRPFLDFLAPVALADERPDADYLLDRIALSELGEPENRTQLHRTVEALAKGRGAGYEETLFELATKIEAARELIAEPTTSRLAAKLRAAGLSEPETTEIVGWLLAGVDSDRLWAHTDALVRSKAKDTTYTEEIDR